jgi:hypothetical protein
MNRFYNAPAAIPFSTLFAIKAAAEGCMQTIFFFEEKKL